MPTAAMPPAPSRKPDMSVVEQTPDNRQPVSAAAPRSGKRPSKKPWPWTIINFWLDSTLLLNFLALAWVSAIIRFIFPTASVSQGWTLWGFSLDSFMGLQFVLLATFAFGIVLHLMLHWSWVCGVLFGRILPKEKGAPLPDDGTRTIYGVGLMIVILNVLGVLIAAAALSIQSPL
jgi:hypothetical protein